MFSHTIFILLSFFLALVLPITALPLPSIAPHSSSVTVGRPSSNLAPVDVPVHRLPRAFSDTFNFPSRIALGADANKDNFVMNRWGRNNNRGGRGRGRGREGD
ncbi:hypothetical protein BDV98DRAFT_569446 [Pterulicium gracile]|uniref:Uncharacterized protein n=1 Tax=Pterulicium gracile TaxID=1884261 RepID=A0A5C3QET8_9AGAR|nr:hypothetical protein BDV98DRAFT_569446 [Pterula gracilis]